MSVQPSSPSIKIAFLGAGRVARALAQALQQAGYSIAAIASRSANTSKALAQPLSADDYGVDLQSAADRADFIFLTVPDDAIAPTAAQLRVRAGQAVVHCSGATELDVLAPLAAQGATVGGFHPLFLFAGLDDDALRLRGCAVTLEANEPLRSTLQSMVAAIGCQPLTIPVGQRALYHAGAQYAASFVLCLMAEATRLWEQLGIPPEAAQQALWPLLKGTVASAEQAGLAGALAGPISRGDVAVLEKHLAALAQVPSTENAALQPLALYQALSQRALQLATERGRPSADVLTMLMEALAKR